MRIDSHQHFWRYNRIEYGWMGDTLANLRRDFLPTDLKPLLAATDFDGTLAVQARQTLAETEWLLDLADRFDFIKGVVGWVDLRSPHVDAQLDQVSRHPKLRGIRHVVHDEPDDRFMLGADFLAGLNQLRGFGLTYDLLLLPRHLPIAAEVIRRFPRQHFVLDHIAKPPIKDHHIDAWERDLRQLAGFDNVFCKLSGMVTEADWRQWQPGDFDPYLDIVFDAFGVERLMFGSDWPVCTVAADYEQVVGLAEDYVARRAPHAHDAIFGGTAATVYGLTK
ncbi:MAG: amidohydrolase family protein [Anaerolineae bacterium]|nr:amidohydrolase family protein [Anaerolineae bacterium]